MTLKEVSKRRIAAHTKPGLKEQLNRYCAAHHVRVSNFIAKAVYNELMADGTIQPVACNDDLYYRIEDELAAIPYTEGLRSNGGLFLKNLMVVAAI